MNLHRFDDAVIGAGIMGLAVAHQLAIRGRRVIVFDRHQSPRGASIRNFGMLWPIGQPAGARRTLATRSRSLWLDVLSQAGVWHERSGSLHLAYNDDEARVLQEFHSECRLERFACELLEPAHAVEACPPIREEHLQLALWSPNEVCVDPRSVSPGLIGWLGHALGVTFHLGATVTHCQPPFVQTGSRMWEVDRAWVCTGDETHTLFPEELSQMGLVHCKLQMMRSGPVASRLGPMLAAGLTLAHYSSFEACPSLPSLKQRLADEYPDYVQFGIHVMVSQNEEGELTIGDSHQYEEEIEPFDRAQIDWLILQYLNRFLDTSGIDIASRWHGYYARHPSEPYLVISPVPGVVVITGLGGHGMTLSFGLAEQVVSETLGD